MYDRTPSLRSIPQFLRRPKERAPAKLEFRPRGEAEPVARRPGPPDPAKVIHGGVAPVSPDFLEAALIETPGARPAPEVVEASEPAPHAAPAVPQPRRGGLPWLARKTNGAQAPRDGVVDLTAHRDAARATPPQGQQEGLLLASSTEAIPHDDEDLAFQVTLPRSVIRQIRVCAAEDGTTHRAIILRALRAAGLAIPEGADVDRRGAAAWRRHQA